MNIAVVGSRKYPNLRLVQQFVRRLPRGTTVVSGGAIGVDRMAERAARESGHGVDVYLPDYDRNGRRAPHVRNAAIADACDELVAFWDGESRGTVSACNFALSMVKRVTVVLPNGKARIFNPRELTASQDFTEYVRTVRDAKRRQGAPVGLARKEQDASKR